MSTEQFRALAAVCLMVVTACFVVAVFQLNGIKVAEQRQACENVSPTYGPINGPHYLSPSYIHWDCRKVKFGDVPFGQKAS
jgi:hypothetical protein